MGKAGGLGRLLASAAKRKLSAIWVTAKNNSSSFPRQRTDACQFPSRNLSTFLKTGRGSWVGEDVGKGFGGTTEEGSGGRLQSCHIRPEC